MGTLKELSQHVQIRDGWLIGRRFPPGNGVGRGPYCFRQFLLADTGVSPTCPQFSNSVPDPTVDIARLPRHG